MATLTENEVIDIIYGFYETDDTGWDTTSPEYVTARAFCNAAINDWANKPNKRRELFSTLTAAADGTKTTTSGTWSYSCPTNFKDIVSWVRTVQNNVVTFWEVIPPEKIAKYANTSGKFCYITGSLKSGFNLNFNQKETLTTGDTINYEYYAKPTLYTGASTTSEISDPYYCVYYTLARLLKNDGEDFSYEEGMRRDILDTMETNNLLSPWDIHNTIEEPLNTGTGFGV